MNDLPLVTIAIPAYKTDFLSTALSSALNQTYANLEILVIDDCSPNDIKAVVDSFSNSKLSYYRNSENLGVGDPSQNWNQCLKLAHGDFLCLLCDDDFYEPTFVENMIALSAKHPHASIFRGGVKMIDENMNIIGLFPLAPEHENVLEYIWHLHSGNNRQTISEWMLRISALHEIGGYVNAPKAWGSDAMTIFALGRKSEIITSPERLVGFRMSGINITGMEHSYIKEKIIGWNSQCQMAADIVKSSAIEFPNVILDEIHRDHKHWTKNLIKHATMAELTSLFKMRHSYHIKLPWFIKTAFYILLKALHLKK